MVFEKYLEPKDGSALSHPPFDHNVDYRDAMGMDSTPFSTSVQFQMPPFMYSGPPTLAPGGGGEVLPALMFNPSGYLASSWLSNNGFTPKFSEESLFQLSSKQHLALQDESPELQQPPYSASAPFDYDALPIDSSSASSSSRGSSFSSNPDFLTDPTTTNPSPFAAHGQLSLTARDFLALKSSASLSAPSPFGLPVYSASGFDLMSILARVATRPHPRVNLGPVDLTCSFVVVDVRRHDNPIVYCSPSFCRLTGYNENEILGKNCRFLQAPDGIVQRGELRKHTSPESVSLLKKSLSADKECQTSMINYKKGGGAFINLITVIPISGGLTGQPHEADEVVYHVGFQVDLTKQPEAILQKLEDGSYFANNSYNTLIPPPLMLSRDRKSRPIGPTIVSKELRTLIDDPAFLLSLPLSTSTHMGPPTSIDKLDALEHNQMLSLLLLEAATDFIHVVSLKGSLLYVAPSVRRVLGYEPEELVGKSLADFCHPADVVPLMRELKESSATPGAGTPDGHSTNDAAPSPRTVDLLFRAQKKSGQYVWVECRGRLHVEPGKGRKAIILSGRAREMSSLQWSAIARAGGLSRSLQVARKIEEGSRAESESKVQRDFWGTLSPQGKFLVAGIEAQDVLGWDTGDLVGKPIGIFLTEDHNVRRTVEDEILRISQRASNESKNIFCRMMRKDGNNVHVQLILYRSQCSPPVSLPPSPATFASAFSSDILPPPPVIYQVKIRDLMNSPPAGLLVHSLTSDVFEELDTSRASSWQYELQQLKFANQRLADEISTLEAEPAYQQSPPLSSDRSPMQSSHVYQPQRYGLSAQSMPTYLQPPQPPPQPQHYDWSSANTTASRFHQPRPSGTCKRSWGAISESGSTSTFISSPSL